MHKFWMVIFIEVNEIQSPILIRERQGEREVSNNLNEHSLSFGH